MSSFSLAFQRIRRSPYQAFAAISIMTMTLFLACIFTLVAAGSQAIMNYFESRPQVNAYFKPDYTPSPQEVDRLTAQLKSSGKVAEVVYISHDEALKLYKEFNQSDPLLLEAVTAEMLPASLQISPKTSGDLAAIAGSLKTESTIQDIRYAQDIVDKLAVWTKSVRVVGISLVGVHVVITLMIILLVISIKVANRREEITVLQLLGATRGYIAAPFIFEGMVYGVLGAIIAWGISYLLLLYSMGFLVSFLAGIPILPVPVLFMLAVLGIQVILGLLVGSIGGVLAVRRFLRA